MKIGIQGDKGSACEMAALHFCQDRGFQDAQFEYLVTAQNVLDAHDSKSIDYGLLALESPIGTAVAETAEALEGRELPEIAAEAHLEVRHSIFAKQKLSSSEYTQIVSHPIPLEKHKDFLGEHFPNAIPIPVEDTGLAAKKLAEGSFSDETLIIAMPSVKEHYALEVVVEDLPANDNYLTRFVLIC